MLNLEEFELKKNALLKSYRRVLDSAYLPIAVHGATIDHADIRTSIDSLSNERFVISVCGQIKVGKSTFLNDLLFGLPLLPSADTPETAKLTEIAYGESFRYEAHFYTPEEFRELKRLTVTGEGGKETTYYQAYIKEGIDAWCRQNGEILYEDKILAEGSKTGTKSDDLRQFISKNGKYTPFVKSVKIVYPSDILRDVIFIDTPGTNDPNPFRSEVTEKWIKNSDAVIFLMYAGAAFSRQDEEFINHFLLPVPSERILVALSKIDSVENVSRPKAYVEQALATVPGFAKTLKNREVYPIAPLFSFYPKLWKRHQEGQLSLDEDILADIHFQLHERPGDFDALIASQGHMPEFRDAIERHLVAGKGEGILASHTRKIQAVYEYASLRIREQQSHLQEAFELHRLDEDELRTRQETLTSARKLAYDLEQGARAHQKRVLQTFEDDLRAAVENVRKALTSEATRLIKSAGNLAYIEKHLAWDLKASFEQCIREVFKPDIERSYSKAGGAIKDHLSEVRLRASDIKLIDTRSIDLIFGNFFVSDTLRKISGMINLHFNEEFLKSLRETKFYFLTDEEKTITAFTAEIKRFFSADGNFHSSIELNTRDEFRSAVETSFNELFDGIKSQISSVSKVIEDLLNEQGDSEMKRGQILKELESLSGEEDQLKREIVEIAAMLEPTHSSPHRTAPV
jgi:hypothetical protein